MDSMESISLEQPMLDTGEPPNKKLKRAYRACTHCRSRKARCDLGDTQNPREPPCSRCRRELRECVFVPSRRGGRIKKSDHELTTPAAAAPGDHPASVLVASSDLPPPPPPVAPSSHTHASNRPDSPQQHHVGGPLVSAKIHNPSDALELLVMTAEGRGEGDGGGGNNNNSNPGSAAANADEHVTPSDASPHSLHHHPSPPDTANLSLEGVPICQQGLVQPQQLRHLLLDVFFPNIHPMFPFVAPSRIPRDPAALALFASAEPHLTLAAVIVASRTEKDGDIHAKASDAFEAELTRLVLGQVPTLGSIEALLLLSEHVPRQKTDYVSEIQRMRQEERIAWNFIGLAIRFGYLLGLDQATFISSKPQDPHELQYFERQRVCWTHCYIHDRSIAIQLGKAFWSRGPGLCFDVRPMLLPVAEGGHRNFPSMRPEKAGDNDFAALLQAHIELTQILSSAHDVLFSTKEQTMSLQKSGGYYTFLDQFRHALNSFHTAWAGQRWPSQTLYDVLWATYHYARQYCYSFAFSAHVSRFADAAGIESSSAPASTFPRGVPSTPDAKYIVEAIDAAEEVLRIFVESLYQRGTLAWLPDRFFSYWAYSAVFLLKAVFVAAVTPEKQRHILRQVKSSTFCLASASPDEQHVGVRYARLLNGLIRTFSNSEIHTPRYTATSGPDGLPPPGGSQAGHTNGITQDIDFTNPFSDFIGVSFGQHAPPGPNPFPLEGDSTTAPAPVGFPSASYGFPFDPSQLDLRPSALDDPISAFLNEQALDSEFWRSLQPQ